MPNNRRKDPGLDTSYFAIIYNHLQAFTKQHRFSWGDSCHLYGIWKSGGDADPIMCLTREYPPSRSAGYPVSRLGVSEPPHGLL